MINKKIPGDALGIFQYMKQVSATRSQLPQLL